MTAYERQMQRIKYLEVEDGVTLGYEELGEGDKYILCLHMGYPEKYYVREFAKYGYHVFLIWNRGSGPSSPATVDFWADWYNVWADDVVKFADKLGIDRFIYTGASHGAGTGWHILWRHQERVKAFIAVVPGPHNIEEDPTCFRLIIEANPGKNFLSDDSTDPAILRRRAKYAEYNKEAHAHQLTMNYGRPMRQLGTEEKLIELMRTFKTPTLIMGGIEDMISTPDLMLRTAKALPNCKMVVYSGLGHSATSTDILEEVMPEYLNFLNAVETNDGHVYARVIED